MVDQPRINQFADATGDHQWIHVDPDRAASGPFGATIAHGFLTLSMLPLFIQDALRFDDVRMSVNYGLNRVRFTAPVPVGSELRARFRLVGIEDVAGQGMQVTMEATIERKGSDKPVCVAETISRRYV
jgi:acyl dehydratase